MPEPNRDIEEKWDILKTLNRKSTQFLSKTHTCFLSDHLRLDDGMAAIERGLAVFIPPMTAAAFAALKLLTQFGDLEGFTDRHTL